MGPRPAATVLERRDEPLLAHAIDGVDRVALVVVGDLRHAFGGRTLARLDDVAADGGVQVTERDEPLLDVGV